jgi:hypothetical protein
MLLIVESGHFSEKVWLKNHAFLSSGSLNSRERIASKPGHRDMLRNSTREDNRPAVIEEARPVTSFKRLNSFKISAARAENELNTMAILLISRRWRIANKGR